MNNTIWQVTELSRSFAVVIAVVCGRYCGRLWSFAVVFVVICGRLRLFSAILSRFKSLFGYLRSFAVVFVVICGRLRSFAAILSRFKSLFGYFRSFAVVIRLFSVVTWA